MEPPVLLARLMPEPVSVMPAETVTEPPVIFCTCAEPPVAEAGDAPAIGHDGGSAIDIEPLAHGVRNRGIREPEGSAAGLDIDPVAAVAGEDLIRAGDRASDGGGQQSGAGRYLDRAAGDGKVPPVLASETPATPAALPVLSMERLLKFVAPVEFWTLTAAVVAPATGAPMTVAPKPRLPVAPVMAMPVVARLVILTAPNAVLPLP
jgi:hypothetical protein